jgi:hypothetical protein
MPLKLRKCAEIFRTECVIVCEAAGSEGGEYAGLYSRVVWYKSTDNSEVEIHK